VFDFTPAAKATLYFIGVTTAKSSIMRIFPLWAKELKLGDVAIRGVDLPLHAPAAAYREVVEFLKNDPLSLGALVTTHKLDLYAACRDQFDYVDPYAEKLAEVSCLSKKDGKFRAHAKDPISCGLALESFVPANFWRDHGGEVLLLGAGGSSLAMSLYFARERSGGDVPETVILANRSRPRLDSAADALRGLNPGIKFVYKHNPTPEDNDETVAALPPYSLIVNATGLGKDAPGSPITDAAEFPRNGLVWEINYRGDLIFMRQALARREAKNLRVEDGRTYFVHGWTQVVAEVFRVAIDREMTERLNRVTWDA
jgi:shikimate 5-dehydrogenase